VTKDKIETALALKSSKEFNKDSTMNRLMFAGLSTFVLMITAAPFLSGTIAAKPPSGDNNPSDRNNRTVDTSDVTAARPPAGDLNPQDRSNPIVDSSQVIG